MAYSDRLIFDSLRRFSGREDVTAADIARDACIPFRTVQRALSRLERSGRIVRSGRGRRWGSRYDVKEDTVEA